MKKAIEKPNLPANIVDTCAVGEIFEQVIAALEERRVSVLSLTMDKRLSYTVCHHADMLICHVYAEQVICGSKANMALIESIGLKALPARKVPQPKYPSDVHLNQLIVGRFAAGRQDTCDPFVLEMLGQQKINYIDINQGYARCSAAVVTEKAIITADYAVAKAAKRADLDVLVIRPGYIELPDYEYGFIGGTCGLIAPDRMVFTGDIMRHPDGKSIVDFLRKHHVVPDCLNNNILFDIGGILPLMEKH